MIIPDVNLLLYSYDSRSPFHAKAASWLEACFSGKETLAFPHVVIFGFVRLATSRRVFQNPMSVSEAGGVVRTWLKQRMARVVLPGPAHADSVLSLLESVGTAANLATDAQIAAIAMENRAVLHTADTDFLRFAGLRWFNPITGTRSGSLRTE